MYAHVARRLTTVALAATIVAALAGCGSDDRGPLEVDRLPPLAAQTWHVHVADGQPMPALVGHGTVDGALEQTFLDSAQVSVDANGRWEQRSWTQRFRSGDLVAHVPRIDAGVWTVTDSGYLFKSDLLGDRFVVREIPGETVNANLRIEALPGLIVAALRRAPPPASPTGAWVAGSVRGTPIPAAIYVFDPFQENGRTISVHLVVDSVRLALHPNGQYRHRIWYTEWEGLPGGSWQTVRSRWTVGDFGAWTRTGNVLQLESNWIQNHRMTATFDATTRLLTMPHGLTPGDEPVAFGYRR